MELHKDQKRVQNVVLPFFMAQAVEEHEDAVRGCILLNRLFTQGPDPLYLMDTCPAEFTRLCELVGLSFEEGREGIEEAHWFGPGCLLGADGGLSSDTTSHAFSELPKAWRKEILWLLLASVSDCTEEGYSEEVSIGDRIRKATRAALNLAALIKRSPSALLGSALATYAEFDKDTPVTMDEQGFPHSEGDHAFYVLYKRGFKCVAVETPSLTFWGTTPDTTLEEQGVTVNKSISPHFGLVFK